MSSEREQARQDLEAARLAHTLALMEVEAWPRDPEEAALRRIRKREAIREGRRAWRDYQRAATAAMVAQIEAVGE